MTNKALTQGRLIQFIQLSAIIHLEVGERALGDHPQNSGKNHGMVLIQQVLRAKGLH